jgi:E3 ubiquitin-protein ligase HERC4
VENLDEKVAQVACGHFHTLLLTIQGLVYSFGLNKDGQLGTITQHESTITPQLVEDICHIPMCSIAAGSFCASVAQDTGAVYLWGSGSFGNFRTPHRVRKITERVIQVKIGD